jgi:hypothetical protein
MLENKNIALDQEESNEELLPLTDWANAPELKDLKKDLEDAKSAHDTHVAKVTSWLDNLNITGKAKPIKRKGRSSVQPKLIRKQAEWRYASLSEPFLSTEDIFNADPVTYEDRSAAIQNGLVLNNQFNTKLNKISFIDEYIRAAVDEGTVIVRVGWDFEEAEEAITVPDYQYTQSQDPAEIQQFIALHQAMQEDPSVLDQLDEDARRVHEVAMEFGIAVTETIVGEHVENRVKVVKNHPTVEVCDYTNVTIDPSCKGNMDKAQFLVFSFETDLSSLKKDKRYKNVDKITVSASSVLSQPDHESHNETDFTFKDKPRQKFVAYEYWGYWDINGTGTVEPFVATWAGDTLIRMELSPFPDKKIPFVLVQYLPVRKEIYGEPDGELLEDNQKIIGAVTRGMIDIMARSANGQIGTQKGALDVTNKRKFDAGNDYEYNGNNDPRLSFFMHTYPEIPRSAEYMLNMQNADAESMSGVKAFHQGITGNALGDTATGQVNALDATAKRELGILRRLAEGIKQVGRKIISMNAEFLDEEEVIRVTNEEFVTVRRDDLAGNFDLRLSISTAEADAAKAKELSFMLQTMGNNMDPAMTRMILTDFARLRKMPELAKSIESYQPQPDPLIEEEKRLKVELLQAQVFNERQKGLENQADVDLKVAKTRNLDSKSDNEDLIFLDKESGAERQHEENMKKVDTQNQINLKAVESLLTDKKEKLTTKI